MSLETAMDDVKSLAKKIVTWIDGHFGLSQYIDHGDSQAPVSPSVSNAGVNETQDLGKIDKGL